MNGLIKVHVVNYGNCKNLVLRYVDPSTGKQVRKASDTTNMKEARKKATLWERELNNGTDQGRFTATWQGFRLRYESEVVTSLAPRTGDKIAGIFNTVENFLPIVKNGLLRELTAEKISAYQSELRNIGRSENTIRGHLAHLSAALAWAVDQGLILSLPKIKKLKRVRQSGKSDVMKGRPISGEEFDRMLVTVPKVLSGSMARGKVKKGNTPIPHEVTPVEVESWRFLLRGLWWSGLRLGEAINLSWDNPRKIRVDLSAKRPMLHIPGDLQKSGKTQLYPIAPEFAEFLLAVPEGQRRGFVFNPQSKTRGVIRTTNFVGNVLSAIGKAAQVKVQTKTKRGLKTGEKIESIKFASAHDLRRSFGERWAGRILPQILMGLMRHESIETTLRYYIGRNALRTAESVWEAYEKSQPGTVLGTVADLEQQTFDHKTT